MNLFLKKIKQAYSPNKPAFVYRIIYYFHLIVFNC